jgi:hypothetical protein
MKRRTVGLALLDGIEEGRRSHLLDRRRGVRRAVRTEINGSTARSLCVPPGQLSEGCATGARLSWFLPPVSMIFSWGSASWGRRRNQSTRPCGAQSLRSTTTSWPPFFWKYQDRVERICGRRRRRARSSSKLPWERAGGSMYQCSTANRHPDRPKDGGCLRQPSLLGTGHLLHVLKASGSRDRGGAGCHIWARPACGTAPRDDLSRGFPGSGGKELNRRPLGYELSDRPLTGRMPSAVVAPDQGVADAA